MGHTQSGVKVVQGRHQLPEDAPRFHLIKTIRTKLAHPRQEIAFPQRHEEQKPTLNQTSHVIHSDQIFMWMLHQQRGRVHLPVHVTLEVNFVSSDRSCIGELLAT